eukprot:scaffold10974_cov37-Tisochrysis_lutea.AAC.4
MIAWQRQTTNDATDLCHRPGGREVCSPETSDIFLRIEVDRGCDKDFACSQPRASARVGRAREAGA